MKPAPEPTCVVVAPVSQAVVLLELSVMSLGSFAAAGRARATFAATTPPAASVALRMRERRSAVLRSVVVDS